LILSKSTYRNLLSFDIFIKLLFILSISTIFFVPYGVRVYKVLGVILISFFALVSIEKKVFFSLNRLKSYKIEILAILISIIFLCFNLIPSTFGTISLMAISYFFVEKTKWNKSIIIKSFLSVASLVLTWNLFAFHYRPGWVLTDYNSNYLAILFFFLFLASRKYKYRVGEVLAVIAMLTLGVRNLQLAILLAYIFSMKKTIKLLSVNKIFMLLIAFNIFYFVVGYNYGEVKFSVPKLSLSEGQVKLHETNLDNIASYRIQLNNIFVDSMLEDKKIFLLGEGSLYKGHEVKSNLMPVHSSWLTVLARHGVIFFFMYFFIFYRLVLKFGNGNEQYILSYFVFSSLLHGMLETFPLLAFISFLIIAPVDSTLYSENMKKPSI